MPHYIILVLIFVSGFLIYSNTFYHSFQFDDVQQIVDNPRLRDIGNLWPPSGLRYLGVLSFALNYKLGGLNTFGYHLVNITIHCINALLVYWLAFLSLTTPAASSDLSLKETEGAITNRDKIALIASLFFLAHPVQTQAVTYITQRFTSLATMFYILALIFYINARLSSQASRLAFIYYPGSFLSTLLAVGSKEIAATLPLTILIYELFFFPSSGLPWRKRFRGLLNYFIPIFLIISLIPLSFMNTSKPIGELIGDISTVTKETMFISRWDYLLTQFRVVVTYIRLLFLPINQTLDYDYPIFHYTTQPQVLLSLSLHLALTGLAAYLFLRSRKTGNGLLLLVSFGIVWFYLTLSVESSVIPIKDVIFEHRLYLPSAGGITAIVAGLFYMSARCGLKRWFFPISVVIFLLLSSATFQRNRVWKDPFTLWSDVVKKSPYNSRAHNNIGTAYERSGRFEAAVMEYKEAIRLWPDFKYGYNNIGNIYTKQGRFEEAIREYQTALRLDPKYPDAHNNIGTAYEILGRNEEAALEYKEALRWKPDFVKAHNNLGVVYDKMGRIEEAVLEYREVLRLKPDSPDTYFNLGIAYGKSGRLEDAVLAYKEALKLKPEDAEVHNSLGNIYDDSGRIEDAMLEYREALRLKPDYAEAYFNMGIAYKKKGLKDEATGAFKNALRVTPDYAEAKRELGYLR